MRVLGGGSLFFRGPGANIFPESALIGLHSRMCSAGTPVRYSRRINTDDNEIDSNRRKDTYAVGFTVSLDEITDITSLSTNDT